MKPAIHGLIAGVLLLAAVVTVGLATSGDAGSKGQPANNILAQAAEIELGQAKAHQKSALRRISGSTMQATLERMGVRPEAARPHQGQGAPPLLEEQQRRRP